MNNENMRYSKLSEEEAALQYESRKQQLLGNLIEQYQSAQKKPQQQQQSRQSKSQISKQSSLSQTQSEFIIVNTKKQDTPKQLYQLKNKKQQVKKEKPLPKKKLQFIQDESPAISVNDSTPCEEEIKQECPQPIQHPLTEKKDVKKMLLRDIGNLDLEIQRLTKEAKPDAISIQKPPKAYFELRNRPSSKESRISDSSYTKRAGCFKAVVRSSSMKKLQQPKEPTYQSNKHYLNVRSASEKKIDNSMNKTVTIESENKTIDQVRKNQAQSERKIVKPVIQMNRSQSKQDTPKNRCELQENHKPLSQQRSTPIKSILKVQFSQPKNIEASSTKNSCSFFHNHKESYNSQISFSKNKCVEAQIEEAVQLYNNLKSLMMQKNSVLSLKKENSLMPRKTADLFYQHKEAKAIC